MLNTLSQALLTTHIVMGFISLLLFWVPVFARKGGLNHRRVGIWYVWGMSFVAGTAFLLSIENLWQGAGDFALFLGFLSLITARPLLLGVESLKIKRGVTARYHWAHSASSFIVVLAGAGLLFRGLTSDTGMSTLMIIFGVLGMLALKDVFDLIKMGSQKGYALWLNDHIVNMCTAGIAAHTAFLVFGMSSFIQGSMGSVLSIVAWVSPAVIGNLGIVYAKRKYGLSKKKTPKSSVATA